VLDANKGGDGEDGSDDDHNYGEDAEKFHRGREGSALGGLEHKSGDRTTWRGVNRIRAGFDRR
jgi:hypothetical protein